jgi:hypothetical protein
MIEGSCGWIQAGGIFESKSPIWIGEDENVTAKVG